MKTRALPPRNSKNYDVLMWWGHARHGEVSDETAQIVKTAVHEDGLGLFRCIRGIIPKRSKPFWMRPAI